MRPITLILIAVAAVAATGAVIAGNRVIQHRALAAAQARALAARDVEVLVAARPIPQGKMVADADFTWARWPMTTAESDHVIMRKGDASAMAQAPGTAARRAILAGEPITAAALFTPGQGTGFMAAMIAPGMKAVGVTVTAASTASGFVLPGDLVDVILTVDLRKAEVSLPGGGRFASEVVLRGVKVLAVDQTLTPGTTSGLKNRHQRKAPEPAEPRSDDASGEDISMVGKTVALEVTPEQADRLLAAQAVGSLSLALRSLAVADSHSDDPPYTADVDTSRALRTAVGGGVRVVKGGQVEH